MSRLPSVSRQAQPPDWTKTDFFYCKTRAQRAWDVPFGFCLFGIPTLLLRNKLKTCCHAHGVKSRVYAASSLYDFAESSPATVKNAALIRPNAYGLDDRIY